MASKVQPHSPFSRLSRFLKSGPSSPVPQEEDPENEDWYIPYNGPYEQPQTPGMQHEGERDSWGQLVTGWLADDGRNGSDRYGGSTRNRAVSHASALTNSSGVVDPHRQSSHAGRTLARPPTAPMAHLAQVGGIGEVPVPPREPQTPRKSESNRQSFVNLLARGFAVRHSASAGQLGGGAAATPTTSRATAQDPEDTQTLYVRRHPYAFPFTAPLTRDRSPSTSPRPHVTARDVPNHKTAHAETPAYLKPASKPRRSLKASISTPNLRDPPSSTLPPSGHSRSAMPKGRQRWLSPETWCDAIILPRPRFAIRVDPGGGSGRIVSPPGSPVWPPEANPFGQGRPVTVVGSTVETDVVRRPYEARPSVQEVREVAPVAGPSRVHEDPEERAIREEKVEPATVREDANAASDKSKLKPPRPKSFAWDDLALPSPAPSLSKVLEEGKQLEEQRKAWQSQATRSFQNKRTRSMSRARAKSLVQHNGRASAMDVLAERTLLGNQAHPPKVHIRLHPSQSQLFHVSEDHDAATGTGTGAGTGTGTGVGVATFTSSMSQGHTRSHAHSNSVGTNASSRVQTDESFMWGASGAPGGHKRTHSLGKSALRLVRTTASSAANFCGFASAERIVDGDPGTMSTVAELSGAEMLENALQREDTRVIRLRDQKRTEDRNAGRKNGVVLITPATPSASRSPELSPGRWGHSADAGPSEPIGLSPVPSTGSNSAEGVGIAISTPTPSDEAARQVRPGREPLRIAHPYAQGGFFVPRVEIDGETDAGLSTLPPRAENAFERHRQPVIVHPYSPYAQHRYSGRARSHTVQEPVDASDYQEIELSQGGSMFAELTPGYIREFQAEDLRYSPSIVVQPVEQEQRHDASSSGPMRVHPYASQSKRVSEWGFADALTHTMRGRASPDSGLGTSESHAVAQDADVGPPPLPSVPDSAIHIPEPPAEFFNGMLAVPERSPRSTQERPGIGREATQSSSNHTFASSPLENTTPPSFRRHGSSSGMFTDNAAHSAGSSPGLVSHESSPPLSPRPLNSSGDLERFRNLFYQPPARNRSPSEASSKRDQPRQPSDSSPADLSSESTRSVSGLTTLARQLADDLEELREITGNRDTDEHVEASSPMWGRRFGGLRGQRPHEARPDPNIVLSQTSSGSSPSTEAASPLHFTLDQHASLAPPTINVPEDVESASLNSSDFEPPAQDEPNDTLRVGTVEALATPSPLSNPQRLSSRLSLIHFVHGNERSRREDRSYGRVSSQYSSLGAPISDGARSSFMTNTSRMSGLSDFPVPPSEITPEHMSVLNSYFDESPLAQPERPFDPQFASRAEGSLVRESSRGTFGRQNDIGHAL
ncbi:hypothetical protein POSPLADRAFT_1070547 [Postia placenta MAD-698-R-SB12]|uniref:Uncharacterized protein n=1 Tax=Postia placenta MAD-698-R-SB12 TaxID=670580 RepID=A0A1X6MYI0_9APHY|nr:hypothetical protein POSPLADRAFT_1070547 [Postia placenta MAD-698-R-SB12]OSX61276.1 hypothetical protein POSPLADRAFT_1070547 [Postia placenta MAD-698-R-SB12]